MAAVQMKVMPYTGFDSKCGEQSNNNFECNLMILLLVICVIKIPLC